MKSNSDAFYKRVRDEIEATCNSTCILEVLPLYGHIEITRHVYAKSLLPAWNDIRVGMHIVIKVCTGTSFSFIKVRSAYC